MVAAEGVSDVLDVSDARQAALFAPGTVSAADVVGVEFVQALRVDLVQREPARRFPDFDGVERGLVVEIIGRFGLGLQRYVDLFKVNLHAVGIGDTQQFQALVAFDDLFEMAAEFFGGRRRGWARRWSLVGDVDVPTRDLDVPTRPELGIPVAVIDVPVFGHCPHALRLSALF
ncbi:hypothetical protein [Catenulispora sp. MAP5-51]|uniref:hypothetical protein n=1 Tax=unclassified Catenulispora TaxID=414885 RepID=UPI0035160CB2